MNALTIIPPDAVQVSLPETATIADWRDLGRDLFAQRRQVDWLLADWIATGIERFGDQLELGLIGGDLGVEPKQLRNSAKVASAFPPSMRAADLSFEVHAYIAHLPDDQRLETLRQASTEHWGVKEAKSVVTDHRRQAAMFEDNDPERWATLIYRAWNNATPEVRQHAWVLLERAAAGGFKLIDEEEVVDV